MYSYKDCNCSCLHFCIYRCIILEKTIKAVTCNLVLSLWENSELTFWWLYINRIIWAKEKVSYLKFDIFLFKMKEAFGIKFIQGHISPITWLLFFPFKPVPSYSLIFAVSRLSTSLYNNQLIIESSKCHAANHLSITLTGALPLSVSGWILGIS